MTSQPTTVSVIIPALDEEETIAPLLRRLLDGTRTPDEIVVADGGSTDGTRDIVESFADQGVRLVEGPGGIAENRNAAIAAATGEVIACTDAGCLPDPDWLELLTGPFETGARWVAGLSRPAEHHPLQRAIGLAMMPVPEEVDLDNFVPGGASQAFLRTAWEQVGGFPEGFAAGEDTLFGKRMNDLGIRAVVVPAAQVEWQAPTTIGQMLRKAHLWGRADGIAGNSEHSYLRLSVGPLTLAGVTIVQILRLRVSALLPFSLLMAWSASVVRHRFSHLTDPLHKLALPLLHSARTISQTIGWLAGFSRNPRREPLGVYAAKAVRFAGSRARALVRPFLPDEIVARLRKPAGQAYRNNIDMLVDTADEIEPWLRSTPDTYRVGVLPLEGNPPAGLVYVPAGMPEHQRSLLDRAFHSPEIEAALLAVTEPPPVGLRHGNEPTIDPVAAAVDAGAYRGTIPESVFETAHVVRQAGLHHAVAAVAGLSPNPSQRPVAGPGAVVICGTIPMHDVGGGARGPQMAHEMVARGYHVTYLNLYETAEGTDLGLRYAHPDLDQIPADHFDPDLYLTRLSTNDRLVILELPHPRYFPLVGRLRAAGFKVVYDLMDDWSDTGLGGWGYQVEDEMETIRRSDGLVASAPSLVQRLQHMSGRPVALVPNAVNVRLFHPQQHLPPSDLPVGDGPVIEYHGSLYGDWFDWEALERAAREHHGARVVIIGDDRRHPQMPPNVHFLGLKPQHMLPAYLANTDVAIIPFEVSATTHAVSPLKVFEYLAMGVPVASTPLDPVVGLDGVHTDADLSVAITAALEAPRPDASAVAEHHGWGARMETLFASAGLQLRQDPHAEPITISQHAVRHWTPPERRL